MEHFINQIINGIQIGSIYALIALGYTMVYGIIKLINFAHGDLIMIGSYVAFISITHFQLGIIPAFLLAMIFCGLFGVLMDQFAYKPLRNRPRLEALITAMGVSLLIENVARLLPFIGPNYRIFPDVIPLQKFPITEKIVITNLQIINILVAILLMAILQFIIKRTKIGIAMRATSLDHDAARLMGINVNQVISVTFLLGGTLAGAAGVLMAISYPRLSPYMGITPGLKAFIAAVFGGIGNVPGAVLGGFLMGIIETLSTAAYSQLGEGVFFVILIIVLLIKPFGLLGTPLKEKV